MLNHFWSIDVSFEGPPVNSGKRHHFQTFRIEKHFDAVDAS